MRRGVIIEMEMFGEEVVFRDEDDGVYIRGCWCLETRTMVFSEEDDGV